MKKITLVCIVLLFALNIFSCKNYGQNVKMVSHDDTLKVRQKFKELEKNVLSEISYSYGINNSRFYIFSTYEKLQNVALRDPLISDYSNAKAAKKSADKVLKYITELKSSLPGMPDNIEQIINDGLEQLELHYKMRSDALSMIIKGVIDNNVPVIDENENKLRLTVNYLKVGVGAFYAARIKLKFPPSIDDIAPPDFPPHAILRDTTIVGNRDSLISSYKRFGIKFD